MTLSVQRWDTSDTHHEKYSTTFVSTPYFFNDIYAGHLVAIIALDKVGDFFSRSEKLSERHFHVMCDNGYLYAPWSKSPGFRFVSSPDFRNIGEGKGSTFSFVIPFQEGDVVSDHGQSV